MKTKMDIPDKEGQKTTCNCGWWLRWIEVGTKIEK